MLYQRETNLSMSLERFHEILQKLELDQQNQDLWCAIKSWHSKLDLYGKFKLDYETIEEYIEEWKNEYQILVIYQNIVSAVWGYLSPITGKLSGNNKGSEMKKDYTELIEKMSIKYILLIAFIFTGVGVILYLLDQNQKKSKRDRTSRPQGDYSPISPSVRRRALPQKNILILVINADNNERIIDTLKTEGKVTSDIWENLYNSMEALWMGKLGEFDETGLNSNLFAPESSEFSEYDVYFVKIELKEDIQGFDHNRNSLERFDAFEKLTQTEHTVTNISQRLSIRSTENSYLYR